MKISTNIKRIIISLIILIILLSIILINFKGYIIDDTFNVLTFVLSILACIFSCILFAVKIDFNKKANKYISILVFIISILCSYIIIELLNQNILFSLYRKRLIFNFIVIIFLHLFTYAIFGKLNLSIVFSNSIIFILGVTNYTITCFRGTPFVPWDILSMKTAVYVAGSYTFNFNHYILLATSLFSLILSIGLKAKYTIKKQCFNYAFRVVSLAVILITTIVFYKTNIINYFDFENNLWKPIDEYSNNGFLASFIKQSKNLFNDVPKNYSSESVQNILENLEKSSFSNNSCDENPNIIVIMNESYSDLTVNGDFKTTEEYMSYFYGLEENTIRGNTYVSVLGGQTPNSEWEFLTNNSMAFMPYRTVPYQQYIRKRSYSLATTLKNQGYIANAIHPWYGSGYRRNAIYPLLGFDSFKSIETLDNLDYLRKYPTDLSTYKYVIEQFKNKSDNEKIFYFVVTMQNHSGYDLEGYDSTVFLTYIESCPRVEQYLSLMKESDKALEYLINYFENYDEKTLILFFGDHQPPYLEDEFWETIMEDPSNETTKYITPFILWANYDIDEQYVDKISLNYLSMLLLDTAGLKTTPYMEFLRNIQSALPVITGNGYIDTSGNYYTFDEESKYSELLHDYKIIQYNNVFDSKNRVNELFEIN